MALFVALSYGQRVDLQPTCDGQVTEARQANGEALDVHLERQLDEASGAYKRVLSADPPRAPSEAELSSWCCDLLLECSPRRVAIRSPRRSCCHPSQGALDCLPLLLGG